QQSGQTLIDVLCANPGINGAFIFSSRRRHTRSKRDWSSDVCSSDLNFSASGSSAACSIGSGGVLSGGIVASQFTANISTSNGSRSEERRVGKECRIRWMTDDVKKIYIKYADYVEL